MHVSDEEIEERKMEWNAPPLVSKGILGKYARLVSCASEGAVTDPFKSTPYKEVVKNR